MYIEERGIKMFGKNCKNCRYYKDSFCHYFRKPRKIDWKRKDIKHICEVWARKG